MLHINSYSINFEFSKKNGSPGDFSFRLLFAHCTNWNLSFVHFLQRNRNKQTKWTWPSMLNNRGHKRAHLLTQQTKITIYSLPTKENNFRFLCIYILKRQHIDIYRNIYIYTYLYVYVYVYIYIYIYIYTAVSNGKWKTEAGAIFPSLITICSQCKLKFVIGPFVYEETNESPIFKRT
jgi:hypothetical protein